MKGYAKVSIPSGVIEALKSECEKARTFCENERTYEYKSTRITRWMIFFTKKVNEYDWVKMEEAASLNGCVVSQRGHSQYLHFKVNEVIWGYEEIISLVSGDECYLDGELNKLLNDFINKKEEEVKDDTTCNS